MKPAAPVTMIAMDRFLHQNSAGCESKPSGRSIFHAKLQPRTETLIIFVGRIAVAVLVPSHGGDREVTVQQIFRLDIAAPYPLGLIAFDPQIGLSPGKTGIEERVMQKFLLKPDSDAYMRSGGAV